MYGGIAYGSAVDKDYGWTDLTDTLQAGETTLTIQHEVITPDVTVEPYSDPYGISPTNMVVTNGQVVLTFNAQPNDVKIMVRVSKTNAVLKFTKTSVVDKTQFPLVVFNENYTNYDLLMFVYRDTQDNRLIEFLITPEIMDEIFTIYSNYPLFFARQGSGSITYANHYVRYNKNSDNVLQEYAHNYLEIVDVYSVTCNKSIVKDDIFKTGSTTRTLTPISHSNLFDNDIIFITTAENGYASMNNQYANLMGGVKTLQEYISVGISGYNSNILDIMISDTDMSDYYYFMVQGIKFT